MRTFVVPVRCSWKSREKKSDPSSLCVRERKKRDTRDSERERERERERDVWICGKIGSWNSLREGERECIESFVDMCEDQQLELRLEFCVGEMKRCW